MGNVNTENNNTRSKIRDIEDVAMFLESDRAESKKVVHCHGVFDLLHIGHIRHLEEAKKFGDVLVVTVTPDQYVNKGPGRPAFTEHLRAEALAALETVDYVAINKWPLAVEAIGLLRPDFYVKGLEYQEDGKDRTGGITLETAAIESVGGQLAFTNDVTFSSSNLINQHLSSFPAEVTEYLGGFASRYPSGDVIGYLESVASLKLLVIGETIIDEYIYCEAIGKSGKEPVLATHQIGAERFAGGILAIANHVAAFSDQVSLVTFLGRSDSHEKFIREKLNPKIQPSFLYMEGEAPTIVKRRFVEAHPLQKLFELYIMGDGESKAAEVEALNDTLRDLLPQYDAVLVADYGHGMLDSQTVELLCREARFLAVNTQVNAGNLGFNTISKYRRADFICVSEVEIRLDARSSRRELQDIVLEVSEKLSCDRIIITRGQHGCLCYAKDEGFVEVPAFAVQVLDRVGSGDTVFSVTTLCAAQGAPAEITGFLGNVAGAEAVATVGHRSPLQRIPFIRHVETLLK